MFERVRDIMTVGVETRTRTSDLAEVFDLMAQKRYSQVPIVEKDESDVIGMINEASVFRFIRGDGRTLEDLVQRPPPRVSPDSFVDEEFAQSMAHSNTVLVYDGPRLLGIVTNSNLTRLIEHLEPYRIFSKLEQHLREAVQYLLEEPKKNWVLERVFVPSQAARAHACTKEAAPNTLDQTYFSDLVEALKAKKNKRIIQRRYEKWLTEKALLQLVFNLEAIQRVRHDIAHSRLVDAAGLTSLRRAGATVRSVWTKLVEGHPRRRISGRGKIDGSHP